MVYTIGLIQYEPKLKDNEFNRHHSINLMEEAVKKGANLLILPELSNSGYVFDDKADALQFAEELTGETVTEWAKLAKKNDIYIVAGFNEKANDICYNSAILIGPTGLMGNYRKLHLWGIEKDFFEVGNELPEIFDLPFARISIQICYDMWFPELSRIQALNGVDLICVPTNWSATPDGKEYDERGLFVGHYLLVTNSLINNISIACTNRIGKEETIKFIGGSCVVDEGGNIVSEIASYENEEIKLIRMESVSKNKVFLKDLRKDIY